MIVLQQSYFYYSSICNAGHCSGSVDSPSCCGAYAFDTHFLKRPKTTGGYASIVWSLLGFNMGVEQVCVNEFLSGLNRETRTKIVFFPVISFFNT